MIVLAADLGGTSVQVVLYLDGVEHSRADGPGGSMRSGLGGAIAQKLAGLARGLLSRDGLTRADVFVVGAAGAGRSGEREELAAALSAEKVAWRVSVTTDAELARSAAFSGGPGVLLIAGTGSIAVGMDADGRLRRVGGLGWRMGDQGSGYWIGVRALQAVGAMHDGIGPMTHLTESLSRLAGVAGIDGLVRWSTTARVAEVAALAPATIDAADNGDVAAERIVVEGATLLCRLAIAAGAGQLPVALSGGLLSPGRPFRIRVAQELRDRHRVKVELAPFDPCGGAPVLAARSRPGD